MGVGGCELHSPSANGPGAKRCSVCEPAARRRAAAPAPGLPGPRAPTWAPSQRRVPPPRPGISSHSLRAPTMQYIARAGRNWAAALPPFSGRGQGDVQLRPVLGRARWPEAVHRGDRIAHVMVTQPPCCRPMPASLVLTRLVVRCDAGNAAWARPWKNSKYPSLCRSAGEAYRPLFPV